MTAYFDAKGTLFGQIEKRLGADWIREGLYLLEQLDTDVVTDVTVCAACEGFPIDLAEAVHRTVLKYSAACQPVNSTAPEYDEPWQHVQGIGNMLSDLHTIFHEVARRDLEGFSDDPRSPLRALYAKGEEVRERLAEILVLQAAVCRAFEKREGLTEGAAQIRAAQRAWAVVEPADTVVEVYVKEKEDVAGLAGAGKGEKQALERLLCCIRGGPVPPCG